MICTNKLNKKERNDILIKLRDILDEYTSNMQEYIANNKGLTVNNDKKTIMKQTIEKLVSLEMEIVDIRKKSNDIELITTDGSILRENINNCIDTAEETKKRVRTM